MVESWGRGISNILKECTLVGIPKPYFDLEMRGVDVRFSAKVMQTVSGETTQRSTLKTLELIKESPLVTIPELAVALNKSKSALEKQITKLKENQQLERIRPEKGGYCQIKN